MKFHVTAALGFAAILSFASTARAESIGNPVKFVKSVYAMVQAGKAVPEDINTPRLQKLYDVDRKEAGNEVGRIDFDIFMDAQDGTITDVDVRGVPVENASDREVVTAKFRNLGKRHEVHFYFEKVHGEWRLDDARGLTGPEPWTLSLILKYGWDGKN